VADGVAAEDVDAPRAQERDHVRSEYQRSADPVQAKPMPQHVDLPSRQRVLLEVVSREPKDDVDLVRRQPLEEHAFIHLAADVRIWMKRVVVGPTGPQA
jgi:hypothetical protein